MIKNKPYLPILLSTLILLSFACSTRQASPIITDNNTIYYPSNDPDQISVNITLCRKYKKDSNQTIFQGQTFPIYENEKAHALVNIDNYMTCGNKIQMFHIEWVNCEGKKLFTKQVNQIICDTSSVLHSSISTKNREAGKYLVRVYYFRELIAEKYFNLIPKKEYTDSLINHTGAQISFCKKYDKNTGELINQDTSFYKSKNKWINAVVNFKNKPVFDGNKIKFKMEWIAPDSSVTYSKILTFQDNNNQYVVRSSISVGSDTRPPGIYRVNLYWHNEFLTTNSFTLLPAKKKKKKSKYLNIGTIPIIFYSKEDKSTEEELDIHSSFISGANKRVYVSVDLCKAQLNMDKSILIQWLNPDKKVFFKKELALCEIEDLSDIKSSISIDTGKRVPGTYMFRIKYSSKIVTESVFEISDESKE